MTKYDIFISYRRDTGAEYALILQGRLQKRYKVFLDLDELTDGEFPEKIKLAIQHTPVFLLVLSSGSLDRCVNDGDWVRRELELAIQLGKQIIPVKADDTTFTLPEGLPPVIAQRVGDLQHSVVRIGQTLQSDIDRLVRDRIAPYIRHRKLLRWAAAVVAVAFVVAAVVGWQHGRTEKQRQALMTDSLAGFLVYWADDISLDELRALHSIADSMVLVEGGTFTMGAWPDSTGAYGSLVDEELELPAHSATVASFLMGKVEVSIEEWNTIMGMTCAPDSANLPKAGVSFSDCEAFCQRLLQLTNIKFRLPTEAEWEYAARGGSRPDSSRFAGPRGKAPTDVAWYAKNAGQRPHPRDHAHDGLCPNGADLYDMSGNVAEWCDTPFRLYADSSEADAEILDRSAMTVRGGSYQSDEAEITVSHRDPMNANERVATVGLRLVVDCQ